ncbi:MAG: hypothetical protein MJE77_47620 [Proteobacteria bacterium]|nr:hypothetical protein [Pseudomonadota bacterium]
MTALYPESIQKLTEALLTAKGASKTELRQAVEARVAVHSGATREAGTIPADLVDYVDKVALHAYKVVDEDIEKLRTAGYSEDKIFEVTLSAALGAGLARLERSLSLLKGE